MDSIGLFSSRTAEKRAAEAERHCRDDMQVQGTGLIHLFDAARAHRYGRMDERATGAAACRTLSVACAQLLSAVRPNTC